MANAYFKFKQFTVHQDLAAMKVGTDGVLLGAWASLEASHSILDIGTGTGLIALMLAQRNKHANIDAIEIDKQAHQQALINFEQSAWNNRLKAILCDLQSYQAGHRYDLIVSNPPYFNHALKNKCEAKAKARHTESLSYDELIQGVSKNLSETGRFCVILPAEEVEHIKQLASHHKLILNNVLKVKPTPSKPPKRVLLEFSFKNKAMVQNELIIEMFGRHQYSDDYKTLTKDFYLSF